MSRRWQLPGYVVALPVLAALSFLGCGGRGEGTLDVSGQIESQASEIGSRVGGRVVEVLVEEGAAVGQGDVLVRLDAAEAEAALGAAEARLAQAEATLSKLEAGARAEEIRQAEAAVRRAEQQYQLALRGARSQEIRAAEAAVAAARAQRDEVGAELRRVEELYKGNAISQQRYDQARHGLEGAQAQLDAAQERLDALTEGTREEEVGMAKALLDQSVASLDLLRAGARAEDIAGARALRDAAGADVARARVVLDEMTIESPIQGVVESLDLEVGDIVGPGPVAMVVDPEDLELNVYVSGMMLGHLQVGQEVGLTTDSHGEERFVGRILQLATEGEFTPRNLQTVEERVQQVYRVRIGLDSAGGKLRGGMTATAHFAAPDEVLSWVR